MAKKKAASRTAKKKPAPTKTAKKPAKPKRAPRKIKTADDDFVPLDMSEPFPQPHLTEPGDPTPEEQAEALDAMPESEGCGSCEACEGDCNGEQPADPAPPVEGDEAAAAEPSTEIAAPSAPQINPESREELEREHYEAILVLNQDVRRLFFKHKLAKEDTAALKKDLDARSEELQQLISQGPDKPLPLFAQQTSTPSSSAALPAPEQKQLPAPDAPRPEWKGRSVEVLDIAAGAVKWMDKGGISTLGELVDFWNSGRSLYELSNIGPETSALVCDKFADYAKTHPEVYGEEPLPAESDESAATDADEPADDEEAEDDGFAVDDFEPLFPDEPEGDGDGPESEEASEAA